MSLTPAGARDRITLGLALLSFAAGSMDAIAFLVLGGIFTLAMSGNTIVLGLAISQGHFSAAMHSFAALLGYVAGVSVASLSLAKSERGSGWTLGLEALFLASFAALWPFAGDPVHSSVVYGLIVLSAVAMGLQGAIGRTIGIPGIMTVIFTSTYTAIVGDLVERTLAGHRPLLTGLAAQQLTALAAYLGAPSLAASSPRIG
ncbi:YoaK family protein [Nitrobacter hamburgensis]|nr:YoaK family protein [Nitrobacter hamburgensis]